MAYIRRKDLGKFPKTWLVDKDSSAFLLKVRKGYAMKGSEIFNIPIFSFHGKLIKRSR